MSTTISFKIETEEKLIETITVEKSDIDKIIAKLKFLFAVNYTTFSYTTSSDDVIFSFEKWGYDTVNLIKLIKEINLNRAWDAINSIRCSQIDNIAAMVDVNDTDAVAVYALESVREGHIVIFKRDCIRSFKALYLLNIFSHNEELSYVKSDGIREIVPLFHYRCLDIPEFEYLLKHILKVANK